MSDRPPLPQAYWRSSLQLADREPLRGGREEFEGRARLSALLIDRGIASSKIDPTSVAAAARPRASRID